MENVQFRFLRRLTTLSTAILVAMGAATSASAQTINGATLGPFSQFKASGEMASSSFLDLSVTTPGVMLTDKNLRYGLKLRYQLSPLMAIETHYNNLRSTNALADSLNAYVSAATRATAKSYGLDLLGTIPVIDRLSVTGRAGLQTVRNDANFSSSYSTMDMAIIGAPRIFSQARFGFGMQYAISKSVGLRLELEHYYRLSGSTSNTFGSAFSADNISLGVQFRF